MPGNDLSATTALIPVSSDTRATARANITTVLTNIINDIEPKVTPAGLDITTALSFLSGGTYQAATNVGYLNMQDRSADPADNESLYVKSNELYFKDGAGTAFAITSGGAVTGASGNITGGGYGAPVEVAWDSGTHEYRFKKAAGPSALADLVCDKIRFDDAAATFATLGAPGSMAASLDFLLPGTFPASTGVMTLGTAGEMGHTRDVSIDTLTITGQFTHGTRTKYISAGDGSGSTTGSTTLAASGEVYLPGAGTEWFMSLGLDEGDRVLSMTAYFHGVSSSLKDFGIYLKTACDGAAQTLIKTIGSNGTGASSVTLGTINHEINVTATSVAVFAQFTSADLGDKLLGITVDYDHPT